jgi:hypothetical protein
MAIPFLNNINLSDNELQNAKLHITGTAPTSADGQIYFDSSDRLAKYYSNGTDTWVSLKQYSFSNGTFINLSTATAAYAKDVITADLSATGTANNTTYLRGDNTWSPISAIPGTYTWRISDGGDATFIVSGDTVTFSGTTNEIEVAEASKTVTIGLPDDVTIGRDLTVTSTLTVQSTNQSSFAGQVTIPIIPVASTDAASKDYVDNAVVGGLVYQGGYNAATNTPDLDSSPSASIKKGWTYTVTADGLFFTEQVRVGDVIIAEVDAPTTLADWTTVQNNIDLASASQIGIGNVVAATAAALDGLSVAYSNGTGTIGLNINGLPSVSNISSLDLLSLEIPLYNDDTTTSNEKVDIYELLSLASKVTSYATTITDTATVSHGLFSSRDVIVQLYDTVTYETIFADVTRPTVNTVTVTFATTPTNSVRVLVQKIG